MTIKTSHPDLDFVYFMQGFSLFGSISAFFSYGLPSAVAHATEPVHRPAAASFQLCLCQRSAAAAEKEGNYSCAQILPLLQRVISDVAEWVEERFCSRLFSAKA